MITNLQSGLTILVQSSDCIGASVEERQRYPTRTWRFKGKHRNSHHLSKLLAQCWAGGDEFLSSLFCLFSKLHLSWYFVVSLKVMDIQNVMLISSVTNYAFLVSPMWKFLAFVPKQLVVDFFYHGCWLIKSVAMCGCFSISHYYHSYQTALLCSVAWCHRDLTEALWDPLHFQEKHCNSWVLHELLLLSCLGLTT